MGGGGVENEPDGREMHVKRFMHKRKGGSLGRPGQFSEQCDQVDVEKHKNRGGERGVTEIRNNRKKSTPESKAKRFSGQLIETLARS